MFEILSTALLASVPGVVLALIGFLLTRKGANRKLKVEEDGSDMNRFDTLNGAALQLYETEKKRAADAEARLQENTHVMQNTQTQYRELSTQIYDLRDLFMQVVREAQIQLTPEQASRFESTRPRPFGNTVTK